MPLAMPPVREVSLKASIKISSGCAKCPVISGSCRRTRPVMKSGSLSIRKESIPYGTQPIPVSIPYIMKIQWSIPETDYDVDNRGSSALAHPFFLRSLRIQFFKCNDRPDSQRGERGRRQKPLHWMWKDSVELFGGAAFMLCSVRYGCGSLGVISLNGAVIFLYLGILVVVSLIDWDTQIIYDRFHIFIVILAVAHLM